MWWIVDTEEWKVASSPVWIDVADLSGNGELSPVRIIEDGSALGFGESSLTSRRSIETPSTTQIVCHRIGRRNVCSIDWYRGVVILATVKVIEIQQTNILQIIWTTVSDLVDHVCHIFSRYSFGESRQFRRIDRDDWGVCINLADRNILVLVTGNQAVGFKCVE